MFICGAVVRGASRCHGARSGHVHAANSGRRTTLRCRAAPLTTAAQTENSLITRIINIHHRHEPVDNFN